MAFKLFNQMLDKINIDVRPIDFNFINYISLSHSLLPEKLRYNLKTYNLLLLLS